MPLQRKRAWALAKLVPALVVATGLGACANRLPVFQETDLKQQCQRSDPDCLELGRQAIDSYIEEKTALIEADDGDFRLPGAPSALLYPYRTEYSVLLVHGLNDSAYYMRDIAAVLHAQGFNTVSILLPGHATRPEDMRSITAESWRREVQRGLQMAAMVGRRVTMAGFSLGAALSIDAVLNGEDIAGLFLFSPPFAIVSDVVNAYAGAVCLPGIRSVMVETDLPVNRVKYSHRTANGVCQTYRILQNNEAIANAGIPDSEPLRTRVKRIGRRVTVPTFVAMTYDDARVSPSAIAAFADAVRAPVTLVTFGQGETILSAVRRFPGEVAHISDDALPHSYLLLGDNQYNRQVNPHFARLRAILEKHLQRYFATTNVSAPDSERPMKSSVNQ